MEGDRTVISLPLDDCSHVKGDAEVVFDRSELLVSHPNHSVREQIHFILFNLWEEVLRSIIKESCLDVCAHLIYKLKFE